MASTYLSRTPSTSATDKKKFTLSVWLKKSNTDAYGYILDARGNTAANYTDNIFFHSDNKLQYQGSTAGSAEIDLKTNRLFRDCNAWYHIVVTHDTTEATSSDRVKIWVNGVQETSFSVETYPALNRESYFDGLDSSTLKLGSSYVPSNYFNGSMAHYHFIDGTAYDADTFGETDATTGIWKPKTAPSVTYGTNGFFLKFENSGAFGTDSSGNGNNFTVNGTMTQTIDTPSNVFGVLDPLQNLVTAGSRTLTNGNTTFTSTSSSQAVAYSTLQASQGKYYWETKIDAAGTTGTTSYVGMAGAIYYQNGTKNGGAAYGDSYTTGDIIGCAGDLTTGSVEFFKNGTSQGTISYTPSGDYYSIFYCNFDGSSKGCSVNFGNGYFGTTAVSSAQNPDDGIGIFEYDVPAGYRALCTKSINAEEYS